MAWQVCLNCCQATGPGLTAAVAGELAHFRIAAYDSCGNPFPSGGAKFSTSTAYEGMSTKP